ncbi:NeuD/PglB/VioB family sugar acetyltransferase [Mariniflexile maritimum]|uniref:NeuD/PglB/VioB family sugar acetyltransferase n=1 Tax=Mariniflexile maritimum TaxID=2682493 RepID=UPI001E44823F|nr:NeuD/PglB/VioB family sugar acetyltransferase [Mariniflexile maritimum]
MEKKPKQNIVIIGASGHAKVVIDIVEKENKYHIVGLIDANKPKSYKIFQYHILGTENDLPALMEAFDFKAGVIAIGDNWTRQLVYNKIKKKAPHFDYVSAVHPNAIIGRNVTIGKGTVIMPGTIVNSDTKIEPFCILNTKTTLDHDGHMHEFSSLAPDATVGGNVTIGAFSAICLGARVLQDITIGKHTIVGAAALVNRDIGDNIMAYGVPATVIKTIKAGEKYLYHVDNHIKEKYPIKNAQTIQVISKKIEWDSLLNKIGNYDFYHTYDYHKISKADSKEAVLLSYEEDNVLIAIPLLVRKIPNTKYLDATSVYGYAGPLSKGITATFDPSNFSRALMEYFSKHNYVSVFSRLNPFIENQCALLSNLGIIQNQGKIVNIDLNLSLEDQRSSFRNRLKTHINKSRRLCTVRKAETIADIKSYIDIYHENMDRVKAKKLYYFDEAYFENLLKSTNYKSTILLAIEKETGQIIAGSMFFITNGIVQYHLSGTKNGFLHLTPTKLLIDEMRIIATNNGCKFFNLGGGLGGRDDDSLFDFKSSFSKDFKEFKLWKYIVKQDVYDDLVAKKGVPEDSDFFPLYRSLNDLNINL